MLISYQQPLKYFATLLSCALHILLIILLFFHWFQHYHVPIPDSASPQEDAPVSLYDEPDEPYYAKATKGRPEEALPEPNPAPSSLEQSLDTTPREVESKANPVQKLQKEPLETTDSEEFTQNTSDYIKASPFAKAWADRSPDRPAQQAQQETPATAPKKRRGKSAWVKTTKAAQSQTSTVTSNSKNSGLSQALNTAPRYQPFQLPAMSQGQSEELSIAMDMYSRKVDTAFRENTRIFQRIVRMPTAVHTKVEATLTVDSDGTVGNIVLHQSTGNKDIDTAIKEFFLSVKAPPFPEVIKKVLSVLPRKIRVFIRQIAGVHPLQFQVNW